MPTLSTLCFTENSDVSSKTVWSAVSDLFVSLFYETMPASDHCILYKDFLQNKISTFQKKMSFTSSTSQVEILEAQM